MTPATAAMVPMVAMAVTVLTAAIPITATRSILLLRYMAMARRRSTQRRTTCPIQCCSLTIDLVAGTGAMMAAGADGVAARIASVMGAIVDNVAAIKEKGAATVNAAAMTVVIDKHS